MSFKNNYCSNNVICLETNKQKRLSIYWTFFLLKCHFIIYLNFIETDSYLTLFCQLGCKLTNNFRKNCADSREKLRNAEQCEHTYLSI